MTGEAVRGLPARLGIAALNLLAPGLGLLRLGQTRQALLFLAALPLAYCGLLAVYALIAELSFPVYAVSSAAAVLVLLGSMIGAAVRGWRISRDRAEPSGPWSRWYSIVGVALLFWIVAALFVPLLHGFYKPFYLPSEAMSPTLVKGDRLIGSMRDRDLRRGDVALFRVGEATYIKRVAALPGDSIAMEDGIVVLNGRPVPQEEVGTEQSADPRHPGPLRRLRERFPGEAKWHEIYDSGPTAFDEMAELTVPPGHLFVLGDHRDRSADSRVPREMHGVELLPVGDIQGRALFYTWGPSGRMGQPIGR